MKKFIILFIVLLLISCGDLKPVMIEITYDNGDKEILNIEMRCNGPGVVLIRGCLEGVRDTRCYVRGFKIIKF